jgi:hypothetical protein
VATARQVKQQKEAFLDAFRRTGIISRACEQTAVNRANVYRWQEHDPEFLAAFRIAEVESTEMLEAEALSRAVDGVEKVSANGTPYIDKSDTLLIFLLKARKPHVYRDRVDVAHSGQVAAGPAQVRYVNDWRNADAEAAE